MGKIIGIDLGTTNSCVAVLEGTNAAGIPEVKVIPNAEGARTTPSVVAVTASGERLVGQVAKRQGTTNPENTVYAIKRLMGRKFDDGEVKRHAEGVPYRVVKAPNGDAWAEMQGKPMSPPEISAVVLSTIKQIAEAHVGEPVTEAVITVPAYFDDAQRQATKDAGRIAGLDVKRIINEPTAAALAYGLDKKQKGKGGVVAVYDLGGGTFDISILELNEGVFEVKATNGDTYLGGEDFDQRVINFLAEEFAKANNGKDLRTDKMALQRLREAAEKAKHELSSSTETDINLPFITADQTGPKHLTYTLTRGKLEELTEELVQRSLRPCEQCLKDAGVKREDISEVLLVGGMTRMPLVQKSVKDFFGKETNKEINPDEVVAIGAGVQGGVLTGQVKNVLLLDVTPLTLGVETAGGVATSIIQRNTTIPTKKSMVFSTAADNQPMVSVHVIQGERPMAEDNKTLARFELVGIPPAPRGVPQIEVTFDIDANGIVHVTAKDLGTGKQQSVRITSSSGLTEAEIQRMVTEAESAKDSDKTKRELADVRGNAEGLIYTAEKSLEEYGHVLSDQDREDIAAYLVELKGVMEGSDIEAMREAIKKLEAASHRMAEAMYAEASESMGEGGEGQA